MFMASNQCLLQQFIPKKYIFRLLTLFLLGEPSTYQAGFYLADNVGTFKISLRIPKSH